MICINQAQSMVPLQKNEKSPNRYINDQIKMYIEIIIKDTVFIYFKRYAIIFI